MTRRLHAKEPLNAMPILCIHTIEKQHVKMNIQMGAEPNRWISVTALIPANLGFTTNSEIS